MLIFTAAVEIRMKNKKCIVNTRMKAFNYRKGGILSSDIYRSYKSDSSLIKQQQQQQN